VNVFEYMCRGVSDAGFLDAGFGIRFMRLRLRYCTIAHSAMKVHILVEQYIRCSSLI
jgi:hypothetical protein